MLVFTDDTLFIQRLTPLFEDLKVLAVVEAASMPYMAKEQDLIVLDLENGFSPEWGFDGGTPQFLCPCLAVSNMPNYEEAARLIGYGIRGYGNKYMRDDNFQQAVSVVRAGQMWLIPSILNQFIRKMLPQQGGRETIEVPEFWDQVSKREKEVAQLVSKGLSNQEIADAIYVSLRTVKAHLTSIFRKTGCRDRMELALKVSRMK